MLIVFHNTLRVASDIMPIAVCWYVHLLVCDIILHVHLHQGHPSTGLRQAVRMVSNRARAAVDQKRMRVRSGHVRLGLQKVPLRSGGAERYRLQVSHIDCLFTQTSHHHVIPPDLYIIVWVPYPTMHTL